MTESKSDEYVILLDSSDKFGDTVQGGVSSSTVSFFEFIKFQGAFKKSAAWCKQFVCKLAEKSPDSKVTVINFSGCPDSQPYKAGSGGKCSIEGAGK